MNLNHKLVAKIVLISFQISEKLLKIFVTSYQINKIETGNHIPPKFIVFILFIVFIFGILLGKWESAPGSFLFSLPNNDNLAPFKAPLKDEKDYQAIFRWDAFGPRFGRGIDLHIASDAKSNTDSQTRFGNSYQAPSGYTPDQTNTQSLLAGSLTFTPSEIEVLYLNEKPTYATP